ncbi:MAG: hypothetical protein ACTSX6_14185 [Candidatus Heimdallarchaeaceae archaeon]
MQTGLIIRTIGFLLLPSPIPDFGFTFLIACAIGLFIPKLISEKINNLLLKIPLIGYIISLSMRGLRKLKINEDLISRIIVGYLSTMLIGGILIGFSYYL